MSEKEKGGRAEGKVLPFVRSEEKETPPAELTLEEQQAVLRQILGLDKEMRELEVDLGYLEQAIAAERNPPEETPELRPAEPFKVRMARFLVSLDEKFTWRGRGGKKSQAVPEDILDVAGLERVAAGIREEWNKKNQELKRLQSRITYQKILVEIESQRRQMREMEKKLRGHSLATVEGYDVVINAEYARELGLVKKELRAVPEANRLIEEIVSKKLDPNTDAGKKRLCKEWPEDCQPLFVPLPNYWNKFYPGVKYPEWFTEDRSREKQWSFINVQRLFDGKIVSNLTGEGKPFLPHFNEEAVFISDRHDEDWDKEEDGKKKLQTEAYSDKLLNAVLAAAGKPPQVGCVNIKRETIDELLWLDDPGNRVPSFAATIVLKKLVGNDWKNWEIRCANQREIEGQHNLATHLDGYFLERGVRDGLAGGHRADGGAAYVGGHWRDDADSNLAVRLVLSRKHGD